MMTDDNTAGYRMPGSTAFDLAGPGGSPVWRIFVSTPQGAMPDAGWPVLYLTDGNATFPIAAGAHVLQAPYASRTNIEPGIIVAIGYPVDTPYDLARRSLDLTPPPGRTYPPHQPGAPDLVTGGADAFLNFIETVLKPRITALYPVDTARQTLFGHSFGGLFVLQALFRNPTGFARYVAASPSIFWEDQRILELERQLEIPTGGAGPFLHVGWGEYEGEELAPFQRGARDAADVLAAMAVAQTAARAEAMAERLAARQADRLRVRQEVFRGENHMSVIAAAIGRAVQIAFTLQLPE